MNDSHVIFQEVKTTSGCVIATASLNAPKALNALSLEMIDLVYPKLLEWARRAEIACVVLKGEGGKAFCAGGNIRDLYDSILASNYGKNTYAENFFAKEYRLDHLIHCFSKPIVCLGTGFVMGGGIGLMTGASHRIVSDSSILAMPEISIGLFPDVGSSWFLTRMPDGIGGFIGMTGARMNAGDAIFSGLADYYLPEEQAKCIETYLHTLPWQENTEHNHNIITRLLDELDYSHKDKCPDSILKEHHAEIHKIISGHTPDNILEQLTSSNITWLNKCAKALRKGCPVTAWIVQEQIKRAVSLSLEDTFRMEMGIAIQCTRHKDFCEGIRALLIDRDNKPHWEDDSLSAVSAQKIDTFFTSPWQENQHPLSDLSCHWNK